MIIFLLLPPILPAIRIPLKTLDGQEEAPIEPGALNLSCCPCVASPTPLNPCLLTTPWKPLPLVVPTTSIYSPSIKISAFKISPNFFNTDVDIKRSKGGKGSIVITFTSDKEFERITSVLKK